MNEVEWPESLIKSSWQASRDATKCKRPKTRQLRRWAEGRKEHNRQVAINKAWNKYEDYQEHLKQQAESWLVKVLAERPTMTIH